MTTPFTDLALPYGDGDSLRVYTNEDVAFCQQLLSDCLTTGSSLTRIKDAMRRVCLPASHPVRCQLWPKLIAAKCQVRLTTLLAPTADNDILSDKRVCVSPLAGYELADRSILPTYRLTAEGQHCLRQLLHRLSIDRPDLVFAPQLWPLLALLLHYHSAAVALNCIYALLSLPGMLVQTKRQWLQHCLALEQLGQLGLVPRRVFKKLANTAARETTSVSLNVETNRAELAQWEKVVWKLPLDYVVRIVDCFLVEGPKVLFRAGLVLWRKSPIANIVIPCVNERPENNIHFTDFASLQKVLSSEPTIFLRHMFAIRNFSRSKLQAALDSADLQSGDGLDFQAFLAQPCHSANQPTSVNYLLPSYQSTKAFEHPSELVTPQQLAILVTSIQDNQLAQLSRPILIFSSNQHGTSLQTLYNKLAHTEIPSSLLVVRSASGHSILGAFCSHRWESHARAVYFGNGLCYLFSLGALDNADNLSIYRWVGLSNSAGSGGESTPANQQQFQLSTCDCLHVGGGVNGGSPGLGLDKQLILGTSGCSPTFNNPCLVQHQADRNGVFQSGVGVGCSFDVGAVELIGFEYL